VLLPGQVLLDREDGGHLVAMPPRRVWDQSELSPAEVAAFSWLVVACGKSMMVELPALRDGCVNYWDAGNWSLHDRALPPGRKEPRAHRVVHVHIFGRSPGARDPAWAWGESPAFPRFDDRQAWMAPFRPLDAGECRRVVTRLAAEWQRGFAPGHSQCECSACGYPFVGGGERVCDPCAETAHRDS